MLVSIPTFGCKAFWLTAFKLQPPYKALTTVVINIIWLLLSTLLSIIIILTANWSIHNNLSITKTFVEIHNLEDLIWRISSTVVGLSLAYQVGVTAGDWGMPVWWLCCQRFRWRQAKTIIIFPVPLSRFRDRGLVTTTTGHCLAVSHHTLFWLFLSLS